MTTDRWIWVGCASLGAAVAAIAAHPIVEADPFWHLNLGRAVLDQGSRIVAEPSAVQAFSDPAAVPEWLWSVVTLGLYTLGGGPALTLFVMAIGACIPFALLALLRRTHPDAPAAALMCVSSLVVVLVLARLRVRPQAAFMLLLPLFMALCVRFLEAPSRARAFGLLAVQAVWVQVHGSFVLAPLVFAILAAPKCLRARSRDAWLAPCALLAGIGLLGLTSAYGLDLAGYLSSHGAGDSKRYISDIAPPTWAMFRPGDSPFTAAYMLLFAIAILGAVRGGRPRWEHWALALLGLAMGLNARRFFAAGGILLAPLALDGAVALYAALPRHVGAWSTRVVAVFAAAMLVWTAQHTADRRGPLGELDFDVDRHPRAAARFLRDWPPGTPALTSVSASAAVSFWTDQRIRTYLDTRIPLYFAPADHGLARDAFGDATAFRHAVAFHGFEVAVVERGERVCGFLDDSPEWRLAVVEARYSTFVRDASAGLAGLAPCGPNYLRADACADGGARLGAEIAAMAGRDAAGFRAFLAATHAFYCGRDAATAAKLLPAGPGGPDYARNLRLLRARIAVVSGDVPAALDTLASDLAAGDRDALDVVSPLIERGALDPALARRLLEDAVTKLGDAAPLALRTRLALQCRRVEDAECVREQALRAAARGDARVWPALEWLATAHDSGRVRRDALRWLALERDGMQARR